MLSKKSAFSLVEMLVGIILISLLIAIAIFSFKYQLMAIDKTQRVGINKVLKFNQLRGSIQSIKYYIVDDYDNLNYPMKKLHTYFIGTKNKINYITKNPLFSKEIAVIKLECIDNNLLYTEEKLYGNIDFLRPSVKEDSRKTTLYDNLNRCEFKYILNDIEYDELIDKVPSSIEIGLATMEIDEQFYINIKSDYNNSIKEVENAIYPVE